jgi:hypothetical protein
MCLCHQDSIITLCDHPITSIRSLPSNCACQRTCSSQTVNRSMTNSQMRAVTIEYRPVLSSVHTPQPSTSGRSKETRRAECLMRGVWVNPLQVAKGLCCGCRSVAHCSAPLPHSKKHQTNDPLLQDGRLPLSGPYPHAPQLPWRHPRWVARWVLAQA